MRRYGSFSSGYCIILLAIVINVETAQLDNETYRDLLTSEGLNSLQLAKKYGYPIERHHVITEDGYIIEMHRIPHGINNTGLFNRPPILIAHGSGGSAAEFLIMGHRSIALRLAEAGYDIWIGNSRGTSWSNTHKFISNRSKEYWMFSWHEIGVYDYSAEIDYILNITNHDKLFFIGHSQGCTAFLAMTAERPEMNDKIRLAMLMGPTAYSKHNKNPVVLVICENIKYIEGLMDYLHLYAIPAGPGLTNLIKMLCKSNMKFLCDAYIDLTMGYGVKQNFDTRLMHVGLSNLPASLSFRQLVHYAQIISARRFQKYDYGREQNMKRYGSAEPPLYNISKITAPVALIYGNSDAFASAEDAQDLAKDLPNCAFNYFIDVPMWNHAAFLLAINADRLVNDKLIEMMSQY